MSCETGGKGTCVQKSGVQYYQARQGTHQSQVYRCCGKGSKTPVDRILGGSVTTLSQSSLGSYLTYPIRWSENVLQTQTGTLWWKQSQNGLCDLQAASREVRRTQT